MALRTAAPRERLIDRALEPGDLAHLVIGGGIWPDAVLGAVMCVVRRFMWRVCEAGYLPVRVRMRRTGRQVRTAAEQERCGTFPRDSSPEAYAALLG